MGDVVKFRTRAKTVRLAEPVRALTLGALRDYVDSFPRSMDGMTVELEIMHDGDLIQAQLQSMNAEERCDEVERLYLAGDAEHFVP